MPAITPVIRAGDKTGKATGNIAGISDFGISGGGAVAVGDFGEGFRLTDFDFGVDLGSVDFGVDFGDRHHNSTSHRNSTIIPRLPARIAGVA
jgi:hypothetical protein